MQIITPSGTVAEGDATLSTLKVAQRQAEARGFYTVSKRSGLLTGIAADADVYNFRCIHPRYLIALDFLRVRATVTTPPTAAQEWGLYAQQIVNWDSPTSALGLPSTNTQAGGWRKRTSYPASAVPIIKIGSTTALAVVSYSAATEFVGDMAWELAAGAAVPRSRIAFEKDYTTGSDCPLMFDAFEGFVIRNSILMGAAFVVRLSVEVAWHEVDPGCL